MTFEEIHDKYIDDVQSAIRIHCPSDTWEDVEQTVWASLYTALPSFLGHSSEKTFLFGIVGHKIIDALRNKYKNIRIIDSLKEREGKHEEIAEKATPLLTNREINVLKHLASCHANDVLAEEMFISISTLRTHLKSLYKKLRLHSRGELILFSHRFFGDKNG